MRAVRLRGGSAAGIEGITRVRSAGGAGGWGLISWVRSSAPGTA
ncbi:hypothetical protein KCH_30360 [Kitasatospora cheerisanensis KCTC 2395]|uniref:Uncharacterized protein n=1 Tax=Kitasatospora cheerisanensis KCTC 2395 TaxID=1348663 RepID=A0A066YVJ3_9ACTN|nr:hypothetical protein KCH_30360 [Kitasatospora cheerisanensis KCTC 2395]